MEADSIVGYGDDKRKGNVSMTPIESIYEIHYAVLDLQRYLQSKDKVVSYRAQER
jgi:hypothetical protein